MVGAPERRPGDDIRISSDAVIRVDHLFKSFGPNEVLHDVSLDVAPREVLCVIGPSGSGKSTLLRCIAALEEYDHGRVYIEGQLLGYRETEGGLVRDHARNITRVRRNIGMVFQQFNLWPHRTALGNVTEALTVVKRLRRSVARDLGIAALTKVGLRDKIDQYPAQLSGGQQQRVAIARALALEPHALLFDEPTSALDPELVGEVLLVIRQLAREGMTMVIVTHEMGFARDVADRVLFMDLGRVLEEGPAAEILQRPRSQRLREFLNRWFAQGAAIRDR
jgi:polar amino acid transport system ATP-binding protein